MNAGPKLLTLSAHLAPLKSSARWVVWKWEVDGKGNPTKVPYQAAAPSFKAKSNDPSTWSTYDVASATVQAGLANGIGYVLTDDPAIAAFDLDDCVDRGVLNSWAMGLVEECDSYTEYTPSGTGLRIIGYSNSGVTLNKKYKILNTESSLEIFRKATRFITVTGDTRAELDVPLRDINLIIDHQYETLEAARKPKTASSPKPETERVGPPGEIPADLQILIKDGCEGDRSAKFHYVICRLKDLKYTAKEIEDILFEHPCGIAEKYYEGGRLPKEIQRSYGKAEERPDAETYYDPAGKPLPVIKIMGGEISRIVDEAEQAILASGQPIFVRAGALVRPVTDDVPGTKGRTTKVAKLRELCVASTVDLLAKSAIFIKFDARSKADIRVDPPMAVANVLLAREGLWVLPRLAGVITTPTLRPDGTILSKPGYDAATRMYLALDDKLVVPDMPAKPTRADGEAALGLLKDLLSGFPFVGPVDQAVAVSAVITAVIRGAIPVTPMHANRSHTPGSGKSELVDVISAIATGRRCPVISAGETTEELEKRLASLLREGVPIVSLDNVNGELGGDALCQMTERPTVRIRVLGKTETPEFECRATILSTGNNTIIAGDMVRRTVLCNLDAGMERPELRKFDFNPVDRVLADRGKFVAAAMTIARSYLAAGSPKVCDPIGSYGDWSAMVRAPLIWLKQADPVASMELARAEDPTLTAIAELFEQWREHLVAGDAYTSATLARAAEGLKHSAPEFYDLLFRIAGMGSAINTRRLGQWLSGIRGRPHKGTRLDVTTDNKHGHRYRLVSSDP